jgi:hypothetical protein
MPLNNCLKILLVTAVFSAGCNADESMNIAGKLIYTDGGSNINSIALNSSKHDISTLYKSDGISAINHLVKGNGKEILFDECISGKCSIKQYSMSAGQAKFLRSGSLPSYMSSHDKLFFYDELDGGDNWLFVSSLDDINNATKISEEPKWKTLPSGIKQPVTIPVVQISNDEIIFVGKDGQLWLYYVPNRESSIMDIKGCRPMLWRDGRNQLLCSDWDTWDMFLLDIKTGNKIDMPELKGAYGFVYVPSSDALIYGRTRSNFIFGEAYDIFFYRFSDKNEKRISKDAHLAEGVWIE